MSQTPISIALSKEITAMVDDLGEREHRSRSDVVEEALRQYLGVDEPAVPDWQQELLRVELQSFRREPEQAGVGIDELRSRLRASRAD